MNDLRVCTKSIGFAAAASVATVALTSGAFAGPSGDNPASCLPLALGTNLGSTVGLLNDSNETCPYSGSTSPDAYYCYTPATDTDLSLDLCESGYDTQIYVYDSNLALVALPDGMPACNDDACSSSGGGGFRSFISCVSLAGGSTYFVVVDGWQGDQGPYTLVAGAANPADCLPPGDCTVTCTGTPEGEMCDFGDTAPNDLVNGGCNCTDPAGCFIAISCGDTICGQSYFDGAFRDTDWYSIDITAFGSAALSISGTAEFQSVVGRVDNGGGTISCAGVTAFGEVVVTPPCDPIALVTPDIAGTELWVFVGADFTDIIDCNISTPGLTGPDYGVTVDCAIGCPLDLDDNGEVGFGDLLLILSNWGPCP